MKNCKTPYITYIAILIFIFTASKLTILNSYLDILVAVLFLYTPILFLFIKKRHPSYYGIGKNRAIKSILRALLVAIIIFPLYIAAFYLYNRYVLGLNMDFQGTKLVHQPGLLLFVLNNLLMVAIPEEVFYRGYIQSELKQCDRKKIMLLGTEIGYSFLSVNIMFAIGHIILIPNITRLSVFFPGLVFSWLREKDDNIAGAIIFHWLSNVLSFALFTLLL
ncbi:MAG: myxosortase family intramembrane protease [bacterium]